MSKKKESFSNVLQIKGSISRNIRYILYGVYFVLFVALWKLGEGTALKPFSDVLVSLKELFTVDYFLGDVIESIKLSLTAIALSLALTLVLAYIAVMPLFRPLSLIISKGRFLGLLGIYFMFIVAFDLGFSLQVALLTFGITVFFLTSMYTVITEIPSSRFDYARSLGLSEGQVFWQVVIRGTGDQMLESLRQNAAIGWMMLPGVETIVRVGGIGDILLDKVKYFDREKVLAILFCIILIGIIQDIVLRYIQGVLTPHILVKK